MKLGPESRLARIENETTDERGNNIAFQFVTEAGESQQYWLPTDHLAKLIARFIELLQMASQRGDLPTPEKSSTLIVKPIEATELGLAEGRSPEEGILHVRLGTHGLTFAIQSTQLRGLQNLLNKMLTPGKGRNLQ